MGQSHCEPNFWAKEENEASGYLRKKLFGAESTAKAKILKQERDLHILKNSREASTSGDKWDRRMVEREEFRGRMRWHLLSERSL